MYRETSIEIPSVASLFQIDFRRNYLDYWIISFNSLSYTTSASFSANTELEKLESHFVGAEQKVKSLNSKQVGEPLHRAWEDNVFFSVEWICWDIHIFNAFQHFC